MSSLHVYTLFNENQHHYEYNFLFSLQALIYRRLFTILHALHLDGVDHLIKFIQDFSHVLDSSNHLLLSRNRS